MAAEEINIEKLKDLTTQVELLGLDEKQRNKLVKQELRRMREAKAQEQKLAA